MRKRSRPIIVSKGDGQTSRSAREAVGDASRGARSRHDGSLRRQDDLVDRSRCGDRDAGRSSGPRTGRSVGHRPRPAGPGRPTSSTPVQGWRRIVSATRVAAGPPPTMSARRRGCGKRRSSAVRQRPSSDAVEDEVDDQHRPRKRIGLRQEVDRGERQQLHEEGREEQPREGLAEALVVAVEAEESRARRPGPPPTMAMLPDVNRTLSAGRSASVPGIATCVRRKKAAPSDATAIATSPTNATARNADGRRRRHQERAVRVQNGRLCPSKPERRRRAPGRRSTRRNNRASRRARQRRARPRATASARAATASAAAPARPPCGTKSAATADPSAHERREPAGGLARRERRGSAADGFAAFQSQRLAPQDLSRADPDPRPAPRTSAATSLAASSRATAPPAKTTRRPERAMRAGIRKSSIDVVSGGSGETSDALARHRWRRWRRGRRRALPSASLIRVSRSQKAPSGVGAAPGGARRSAARTPRRRPDPRGPRRAPPRPPARSGCWRR